MPPPAGEDPKRDQYKSKADIVAFVKKSFADGATAIQAEVRTIPVPDWVKAGIDVWMCGRPCRQDRR
jgi:hypothetical protein